MAGITDLTNGAKGMGVLAITVAVVLSILIGFQASLTGTANSTLTTFISAFTNFATFAAIIVLALVGFYVLKLVSGKN